MFDVPILVIAYHRVTEAHNLFAVLQKLQPSKLYVAFDAAIPQDRHDYRMCLKTRCVFMPEWEVNMETLLSKEHLGKSRMFQQAMNWFFENEEEGIILCDDSLPHPDFFPFCQELLNKYRDNKQIVHIGGTNFLKHEQKPSNSYFFSAYPMLWGFATWKDRWEGFDLKMRELQDLNIDDFINQYDFKQRVRNFWNRRYRIVQKDQIDIWEYQYIFHLWKLGGLCIIPNVNLVENSSFRNNKRKKIKKLHKDTQSILPLDSTTPAFVQDRKMDKFIFRRYYKRDFLTLLFQWFHQNVLGNEQ